ncbi:phosphoribulokinase [Ralstonia solanacearum]|nr:phosphoribulokinase [Ralstonia solanacearum]MDB0527151.1 phosphoribulokinase [Ralstonia solanacearum]MDB0567721.1 phosphoribulokinase [Ralstonia solanacearum]MDB0577751.1 phosphoribulokinase [Ralstonia solanacearum]
MKQFDTRPVGIKALFSNALEPVQAAVRQDKMLAARLPI